MPSNRVYIIVVIFAVVLGIATRWPFFNFGLWSDDYVQYAMLKNLFPLERSPFDLFSYSDGSRSEVRALTNFGFLPWWSHPELRFAMFRPLSSALTCFDFYVLEFNPIACHLHSLFWWLLLVYSAALLYRTLLPLWTASLATVFFALEESATAPLVWLANRNASVSLCLCFLALWAHVRWRRENRRRFLVLTLVAFSLALLAGEWAVAALGYYLAYELVGSSDAPSKRVAALFPLGSILLLYTATRALLYDSVSYSNSYISPLTDAFAFLRAALQRFPALLFELTFSLDGFLQSVQWLKRLASLALEILPLSSGIEYQNDACFAVLAGVGVIAVNIAFFLWTLKSPRHDRPRSMSWMLLGSFLALIPMLMPPPTPRLVLPASLGFSAFWSVLLLYCCRYLGQIPRRRPFVIWSIISLGVLPICCFHFIIPVVRSSGQTAVFARYSASVKRWILDADIHDDTVARQDLFLVDSSDHTVAFFTPFVRSFYGRPLPKSCRILNASRWPYDIKRAASNELLLSTLDGTLLSSETETCFNNRARPFQVGDRVELDGLRIDIMRLYRGKPSQVRFVFARTLEHPSYLFLHSTISGLREMSLPKIGETRRVPLPPEPGW